MAGSYLESYVQLQKESAWGTPVATAMTKIPILSWDVQPAYDTYKSQMTTGTAGAPKPVLGVKRVQGSMSMEGGYTGLDHVLYGILGGGGWVSGIADPYVNRYTPASTVPSFTAHVCYGDIPTGTVFQFEGLKFNSVDFQFDAANGLMTVQCDILAEDETSTTTTGTSPGTVAATIVHEPIYVSSGGHIVTLDIGYGASQAYCVRSGNIKIERNLTSTRICLGSSLIKEPIPTTNMTVSGSFAIEFADRAIYDAFIAQTVHTTTQLKWDGGTHSIDFVMPKVVYSSGGLPPITPGEALVGTVNFTAYGSSGSAATAEPINVTVESIISGTAL